MAEKKEIQIVVSAKEAASDILKKVGGLLAATFSIAAIYEFGKAAVNAASAQEDAEMKLAQALGHTSRALTDQAAALQSVTKYEDDSIIAAQAQIAMFTKNETQIKALTRATLDFAAAKGTDLSSAADLVAKAMGSETNALGRYGIEVSGAAGSTARFENIMQGLGRHFGGQAQAQAHTYSGAVAQLKNSFGELLESIGNLIIRNTFVIGALNLTKDVFMNLAKGIDNNQQSLMKLAQSGIVWVVRGLGYVIEAVRFFHNAWNGLKLAADFAIMSIAQGLADLFPLMKAGFDPWFEMLKAFHIISENPLESLQQGLNTFRDSSREVFNSTLDDVEALNQKYDEASGIISGFADKLAALDASRANFNEVGFQRDQQQVERDKKLAQIQLQNKAQVISQTSQLLDQAYRLGNEKYKVFFYLSRAAAASEAIIQGYLGASKAVGTFWGMEMGPVLIAMGYANAAMIMAQSFLGGGGGGGGGGGAGPTGTYPANLVTGQPEPPSTSGEGQTTKIVNVYVQGVISGDNMQEVIEKHVVPALNTAGDKGIQLQTNVIAVT